MATNTPNINLYKKDMAADGNDTFNITTMLNDNWDKIDTKFGQQDKDFIRQPAFLSATSASNVYTATSTPAPTSYVDGMGIILKADKDSTGAITLNWNGLGAKALKDAQGNNVSLKANAIYTFKYNIDIGYFILQGSNIYANGVMQTNLNADMVDGKNASDFATSTQGNKADNALPASSYTASDVLSKIKSVDGSGSGLDADLLDGHDSSYFAKTTDIPTIPNSLPANGGNSTTVNGFTASGTPTTTEKTNLIGMISENHNKFNGFTMSGTANTTEKNNIIGMVNEVFTSANNSLTQVNSGKTNIYNAIVGKKVTPSSSNFADLVTAIGNIPVGANVNIINLQINIGTKFFRDAINAQESYPYISIPKSSMPINTKTLIVYKSSSTSDGIGLYCSEILFTGIYDCHVKYIWPNSQGFLDKVNFQNILSDTDFYYFPIGDSLTTSDMYKCIIIY